MGLHGNVLLFANLAHVSSTAASIQPFSFIYIWYLKIFRVEAATSLIASLASCPVTM